MAGVALGADVRRIPISGESLENLLARTYRPGVAAAIVHPEPFPEAEAWIIEEVLFGPVGAGERLDFSNCAPVLRVGSTPKYIRSLVADAPVVEGEVEEHRTLILPPGRKLTDFAAPRKGRPVPPPLRAAGRA